MLRSLTARTRMLLIIILGSVVVLLVIFSMTRTPAITDPVMMKARVLRDVPIGSTLSHAKQAMQQQRFACEQTLNGDWDAYHQIDYLYCDRTESDGFPIKRRWQIALVYEHDYITDVLVSTGLIGP